MMSAICQNCGSTNNVTQCKCGKWVCPECRVMHWAHNIEEGDNAEPADTHSSSTRRDRAPEGGQDPGDAREEDSRSVVDRPPA